MGCVTTEECEIPNKQSTLLNPGQTIPSTEMNIGSVSCKYCIFCIEHNHSENYVVCEKRQP